MRARRGLTGMRRLVHLSDLHFGRVDERLLQPLADQVGVRVNPRYGVWDTSAMGVAPSEGEKAGFQIAVQQPKP